MCLYSRSHFLCSCDILTASEVSQLFQGINNGSGSPYLTSTVQAVCFVVVLFYLPGYLGETSDTSLLSRPRCSLSLPPVRHTGRHGCSHGCPQSTAFILCVYGCAAGWIPSAAVREFPEVLAGTLLHPLSPSGLCRRSLSLISVVCLSFGSSVTTKQR